MKIFKQDFSDSQSPLANPLLLDSVKLITSSHNSRFKTVHCKILGDLPSADELNQHYVNCCFFYNLIVTHVHMCKCQVL